MLNISYLKKYHIVGFNDMIFRKFLSIKYLKKSHIVDVNDMVSCKSLKIINLYKTISRISSKWFEAKSLIYS
jgi:hypothetical protein